MSQRNPIYAFISTHRANIKPTMNILSRWYRVKLYQRHIAFNRPVNWVDLYSGWKFPNTCVDGYNASAASSRVSSSSTSRNATVCCSWQSLQYSE